MNTTKRPLDVIQVASPCTADWESMRGDDRVRFCGHCQKHVHNLSAMTEDEATRLVCEQAGDLCVRFSRDAKGRTLNYQAPPKRKLGWPAWAFLGTAAAICSWVVGAVVGMPRRTTTVAGALPYRGPMATTSSSFCPMVPPSHAPGTQATTVPSVNDGAP